MQLLTIAALALATAVAPPLSLTARIAGAEGSWDYASVDTAGNRLFVSRADGVMTVDLATRAVTARFVPGQRVHSAFIIPGTGIGFSTNGDTDTATIFDAGTGSIRATVKTGAKPDAAVYDAGSRTVWTMNAGDGTATIIDPVMGKAVGSMTIGGALEFAVVDGHGHLFVNVEDKAEIAMIDMAMRKTVRRTPLAGCDQPSGLALTMRGVLIAACANGVAKTVDAASGKVGGNLVIGPNPDAVLYDAKRNRAYIPSGGDGTLAVIDTSSAPRVIGMVATQRGARTGAVDPATGTVYLPTAKYQAGGTGRSRVLPGSFEVLVVTKQDRKP